MNDVYIFHIAQGHWLISLGKNHSMLSTLFSLCLNGHCGVCNNYECTYVCWLVPPNSVHLRSQDLNEVLSKLRHMLRLSEM